MDFIGGLMAELEIIQAVSTIAGSISTISVLIWWVILERRNVEKAQKRADEAYTIITEDWKRQREEEIERRAEERFQKKMATIPLGGQGV
jgi:hypothetical protein